VHLVTGVPLCLLRSPRDVQAFLLFAPHGQSADDGRAVTEFEIE
jgi:hypothetical protein